MTDKLAEIARRLTRARTISIFCHTNPDGDTLCSALALATALEKMGKKPFVYCDGAVPSKYEFLPNVDKIKAEAAGVADIAIAVDCSDLDRLGSGIKSFMSAKTTAALDHHRSHVVFADISEVDPDAAACAEIVFRLIRLLKAIDKTSAELLFAGIVADTGCFRFSSTTKITHEITCELMGFDFDAENVIYNIHRRVTPQVFALKNLVLGRCGFYENGAIAVINFRKEDFEKTGTCNADTEGIISDVIDIDGVEIAISIAEAAQNSFRVSIRTKKNADAADVASAFGGGGHLRAAGCRLNGFYEDVLEKLISAAKIRL